MSLESIQHLMYVTAFFNIFTYICFASAEHTKETVFSVFMQYSYHIIYPLLIY